MVAAWAGLMVLSPDSWHPIPVMIAEGEWFGMDSLAEAQQMGVAPVAPPRTYNSAERANLAAFEAAVGIESADYDNVTAFDDTVIALGPAQWSRDTARNTLGIMHQLNPQIGTGHHH